MENTHVAFGFAQAELPAWPNMNMAGYAPMRTAKKVHDMPYVSALALCQKGKTLLVGCLDLLACDHLLVTAVKEKLKVRQISYDHLLLCCSHTHSGPAGILDTDHGLGKLFRPFAGEVNSVWIEQASTVIATTLTEALEKVREGEVQAVQTEIEGFSANRIDPESTRPERLAAINLVNDRQDILLLFFACHPTVLEAHSRLLSADYIGVLRNKIKKLGFDGMCFFQGAAGDLSTRYTKERAGYHEMFRFCNLLVDELNAVWPEILPVQTEPFVFETIEFMARLKPRSAPKKALEQYAQAVLASRIPLENSHSAADIRLQQVRMQGADAALFYANNYPGMKKYPLFTQVLVLPDLSVLFVGAELFSSLADTNLPDDCLVVSCVNDYALYLADERAYENGEYEAESSPFVKGEAERFCHTVSQVLEQLKAKLSQEK